MNTDTPRTDQNTGHCICNATHQEDVVPRDTCLDLERENSSLQARVRETERLLAQAKQGEPTDSDEVLRDALRQMLEAFAWKADFSKPKDLHSAVLAAGKALNLTPKI